MKTEGHINSYKQFKRAAEKNLIEKEENPKPIIQDIFYAAFHIIDAVFAIYGIHINKHQKVVWFLKENNEVFKEKTEIIASLFEDLSELRSGRVYGSADNGIAVDTALDCLEQIEAMCKQILGDKIE